MKEKENEIINQQSENNENINIISIMTMAVFFSNIHQCSNQ